MASAESTSTRSARAPDFSQSVDAAPELLEQRETDKSMTTQSAIQLMDADSLTPFPAAALKLIEECRVDVPDSSKIIELIECEPAIAAKVLSVANSPLYGYARQIDTIPRAILVLGARSISSLAVSFSTNEVFTSGAAADGESQQIRQLMLEHSLGTAVVARALAAQDYACDPAAAFLAGILHDIGKLVFFDRAPAQYVLHLPELWNNSVAGEQALFGINHVDIGHRYVCRMGLPGEINRAIADHHQSRPTPTDVGGIVATADQLSKVWGLGTENYAADPDEFQQYCNLDCDDFTALKSAAHESYECIKCVFQG